MLFKTGFDNVRLPSCQIQLGCPEIQTAFLATPPIELQALVYANTGKKGWLRVSK